MDKPSCIPENSAGPALNTPPPSARNPYPGCDSTILTRKTTLLFVRAATLQRPIINARPIRVQSEDVLFVFPEASYKLETETKAFLKTNQPVILLVRPIKIKAGPLYLTINMETMGDPAYVLM